MKTFLGWLSAAVCLFLIVIFSGLDEPIVAFGQNQLEQRQAVAVADEVDQLAGVPQDEPPVAAAPEATPAPTADFAPMPDVSQAPAQPAPAPETSPAPAQPVPNPPAAAPVEGDYLQQIKDPEPYGLAADYRAMFDRVGVGAFNVGRFSDAVAAFGRVCVITLSTGDSAPGHYLFIVMPRYSGEPPYEARQMFDGDATMAEPWLREQFAACA